MLACDASQYRVGVVISHLIEEEEKHIAFSSRTLTKSEQNYSQLKKEALAIIFGIRKYHKYLYGRKFVLLTDHKPLLTILGPKTGVTTFSAARLQRWALQLGTHQYVIRFRKTTDHGNADMLSRLPVPSTDNNLEPDVFLVSYQDDLPVTAKGVAAATKKDIVSSKELDLTLRGWPAHVSDHDLKPYFHRRHELSADNGCLLLGYQVVIPALLRDKILGELHNCHPVMCRMKT